MAIDVFDYIDYRKLLKDLYEERKAANPSFSYRYIALKVGFSSAGFFTNILQGKRNISAENIFRFAAVFRLKRQETEYFELLVNYDQAKNHEQKKYYFEKILASKRSKIRLTEAWQYEFYSQWYYTAVREVIDIYRFEGKDFGELAKKVSPAITPSQAKKAVDLLQKLGMITMGNDGYFVQSDDLITTGYEAPTVAVNNFLVSTIDLAREAIDRYPRDKRTISTLTFSCSAEGYAHIEERLKMFRREILEIVRGDKNRDRVYHVNFHVYPMSRP
ncbi:MAG: TIGR02147 family protein [Chitinispirillaceae bacterium]|nr:TIGR02147 family protein [Chitinispirillaceae bacterium]